MPKEKSATGDNYNPSNFVGLSAQDFRNCVWEVNKLFGIKDENNMTLLHHFAKQGMEHHIIILLNEAKKKKADINIFINAKDNEGKTPLHYAASSFRDSSLKILIKHEANLNIKDNKGKIPLHYAASFNERSQTSDLIIPLINDENINTKDNDGKTALHYAASLWHSDSIAALISKEADINIQDNEGRTPLHYAAINTRNHLFKTLINKNADVNIQDKAGKTPLHYAASFGNSDLIFNKIFFSKTDHLNFNCNRFLCFIGIQSENDICFKRDSGLLKVTYDKCFLPPCVSASIVVSCAVSLLLYAANRALNFCR